jgi:hypothetical protein
MSVTIIVIIVMCDITVQSLLKITNSEGVKQSPSFLMRQNQPSKSGTFYYAMIGGDHPGVTNIRQVRSCHLLSCPLSPFLSSPFLPGGKKQPSWPIAFKCETKKEADAIAHVHALIDKHIGFNLDLNPTQQANLIWRCEAIRQYSASSDLKGPYYPVVYTGLGGTESIVYRDWQ